MKQPLVSIITVVYNGEKTIKKTIQSILNQSYKNIEYIIIDGGSTDKTVEIIKRYEDEISYWVSEEDEGIYDAMNKGVKHASGDFIAILNADDWYESTAVSKSISAIIEHNADYSYASIGYHQNGNITTIKPLAYDTFLPNAYFQMPFPHISAFIKKEIYSKLNAFDTNYKIAGDHDFILRTLLHGYKGVEVPCIVGHALADGISSDFRSNIESYHIAKAHGINFFSATHVLCMQYFKYLTIKYLPTHFVLFLLKVKKSRYQ